MEDNKVKVPINPSHFEVKSDYVKSWEENRPKEYKEYRRRWVENPRGFILERGPLHLDIEVTTACNLGCPMCARTLVLKGTQEQADCFKIGFMDINLYKGIINQAVDMGVYSIKLNRYGEPLLHKEIIEMVRYAKEKGILEVAFNTNAVKLDERISRELILAGLDKIFYSFDSPSKDNYEKIRVGARYEEVLENIRQFTRLKNELASDTPLTRVSMVVMQENRNEYNAFVNLFKDIVDYISWDYCINPQKLGNEEQKTFVPKAVTNFCCSQLWQRMNIGWNGDVMVCCGDVIGGYVVGNAHKEKLVDIWENEKYCFIREKHKSGNCNDISICSKCDITEIPEDGSF